MKKVQRKFNLVVSDELSRFAGTPKLLLDLLDELKLWKVNLVSVKEGIDMFDCVLPTRSGRTGLAYSWEGKLNLKNSKFKDDVSPLDLNCDIKGLKNYSKSYLHHLIKSEEMLASMLISLHNIYFYQQFMREIRSNIKNKTFNIFYKKYINFFD